MYQHGVPSRYHINHNCPNIFKLTRHQFLTASRTATNELLQLYTFMLNSQTKKLKVNIFSTDNFQNKFLINRIIMQSYLKQLKSDRHLLANWNKSLTIKGAVYVRLETKMMQLEVFRMTLKIYRNIIFNFGWVFETTFRNLSLTFLAWWNIIQSLGHIYIINYTAT